jgi:hypothetical protein
MSDGDVFLYQMLKGGVDKRTRDAIGASIATTLGQSLGVPAPTLNPEETEVVQRLERTGFAPVKPMFTGAELDDIDRYFSDKPITFTDGEMGTTNVAVGFLAGRPQGLRFGHWDQDVISGCPAFCRAAYDPELLRIAQAYLGAPPTVTILTVWWTFPAGDAALGGMQHFHHDRDDFRSLKVFTYLTDTTEKTGPHEFVEETHTMAALESFMSRTNWASDQEREKFLRWIEVHRKEEKDAARFFPKENIRTITGTRGTTFFEDTRGLHRGVPPAEAPRMAFEFCYALLPKFNTQYTPIARPRDVPGISPVSAYSTRLFYNA